MADYLTQFSCLLPLGSVANAEQALTIYRQMAADLANEEEAEIGFAATRDATESGGLWICDADGQGDPEQVIAFVLRCAAALDLQGRWGFTWALTCSKPRLDGFGGGAQGLDLGARTSVGWVDCQHWLDIVIAPGEAVPALPE